MKSFQGIELPKLDRLCELCHQLNKISFRYPNIPDLFTISEDLTLGLSDVKDVLLLYVRRIKDLEKEVHCLEGRLKSSERNKSENFEVQRRLLEQEKNFQEQLRELKSDNKKLKSDLSDLEFVYGHTLKKVKELERESIEKSSKILQLTQNKTVVLNADGKAKDDAVHYPVLEISKPLNERTNLRDKLWEVRAQANDVQVVNMVEIMERKCTSLSEELRKLKLENKKQAELISSLRRQASQKDEELIRLRKNADKDDPSSNSNDDYCCHCQQLKSKIGRLELQLMETIEKQHEAMTRAVQLAERNRNLERELKDIDHMAMAVEEECQTKVKQNARSVTILQEKIADKIDEIKRLQTELMEVKVRLDKEKLAVDKLSMEKASLEKTLEDAMTDKKCLNDKINHYIIIERNLRIEVAKSQEMNKSLQRQLNEMEGKLGDTLGNILKGKEKTKPKKKNTVLGLPSSNCIGANLYRQSMIKSYGSGKSDMKIDSCSEHEHKIVGRDRMQKEVNFCFSDCHRIGESECHHWEHPDVNIGCHRKLTEMEQEIELLKQENASLRREKAVLSKSDDFSYCPSGDSFKIMLDRLERERDLALSDVSKLQTERDILRERIKLSTESQIGENSRMERILLENEERIRRLESERRELINTQGSQRANLTAIEEKCDEYKNQIHNLQTDLSRITTHYNQLKTLHEETDRSLTEVHGRLTHTQTELNLTLNKLKELELVNRELEEQISNLKREKSTLKSNMACMEREKDDLVISLDDKTEVCSKQQSELKNREKYISELNDKISDLQKKLDFVLNEKTGRDHAVLSLERDVAHLREELEKCEKQKEAFRAESRRLQDDLTSAIKDSHLARRDLDVERKEVENLKRQLQQYVTEVKRAEELLFQKESERNEMLDHFRSLSMEATALESNNHTLESAMENTKVELIAANNRLMDLEQEISSKTSLVHSYENQIVDLTARVAELESKLKQESEDKTRIEEDLIALRELCSTIDDQKESLRRQASSSDAEKLHLMNEVHRLSEEFEGLSHKLAHERSLSQTLEKSLSHSRQETLEHKISNKDLQTQVQQLTQKIDELTSKLEDESQNVHKYQSQCADLSCQVSELRREVTNARFEKARALDGNRRAPFLDTPNLECFHKDSPDKSHRNIPPLVFLEDSDRTVSSTETFIEDGFPDRPGFKFLSPVLEKPEEKMSKLCEGTSSDLSSLPEDFTRIRNCQKEYAPEFPIERRVTWSSRCQDLLDGFDSSDSTLQQELCLCVDTKDTTLNDFSSGSRTFDILRSCGRSCIQDIDESTYSICQQDKRT